MTSFYYLAVKEGMFAFAEIGVGPVFTLDLTKMTLDDALDELESYLKERGEIPSCVISKPISESQSESIIVTEDLTGQSIIVTEDLMEQYEEGIVLEGLELMVPEFCGPSVSPDREILLMMKSSLN